MPDGITKFAGIAVRTEPFGGFDSKLKKCRVLVGGTESMREASEEYLPKFEYETEEHFNYRRKTTYLFNGLGKTVTDFSGRVFEQPVKLDEDQPSKFAQWVDDVDLQGQSLNLFARQIFEAGLQSGIEYLLVDAPPVVPGETVAEAEAMQNRPYIVHISPEDVLGWQADRIGNRTTLTKFRFMEMVNLPGETEFERTQTKQIRAFDLMDNGRVRMRVFREVKNEAGSNTGEWAQIGDDLFTGLDKITVVPFYANRHSFFTGRPPLDDLADLNIAHWQSQSDQRNILHFARVPILFAKGLPEHSKIKISAASVTMSNSPDSDLKYVEHSGAAIAAGQRDLEHLEFQMQTMGLQFIVNRQGAQTATGENRNEKKETSRLAMMAGGLEEALNQAFGYMGEYQNIDFTGRIRVHRDFRAGGISQPVLNFLIQSVMNGKISKRTFWAEMRRHGLLMDDFDPDAEEVRIEDEAAGLDGIDGMPDDDDDDDDEGAEG